MSINGMFGCVLTTELHDALKADGIDVSIVKGKHIQQWLKSVVEFVIAKHELDKNKS